MPPQRPSQSLRRKSCDACVKSKRGCDRGVPSCRRCLTKNLQCDYPGSVESHRKGEGGLSPDAIELQGDHLFSAASQASPGTQVQRDALVLANTPFSFEDFSSITSLPIQPLDFQQSIPQSLTPSMMSLIEDITGKPHLATPLDLGLSLAPTDNTQQLYTALSTSHSSTRSKKSNDSSIIMGSHFQPRTEYVARLMAKQPVVLAQTGSNCFIHHTQANSSAVLQDALAASALFAMRNPTNANIVRAEISRRAGLLTGAVEAASIHYLPWVHMDFLPPIQALLIYQCIRLFAIGDPAQVNQAEKDQIPLIAWTDILRSELTQVSPSTWDMWIRRETIRRTLVFAEMMWGVYHFLKGGWDDVHERMVDLKFSAQVALWAARSEDEWKMAMLHLPRLEIAVPNTIHDIKHAKPKDLDGLGFIFRATFFGIENMKQWAAGDEDALVKWELKDAGRGWRPADPVVELEMEGRILHHDGVDLGELVSDDTSLSDNGSQGDVMDGHLTPLIKMSVAKWI